MEDQSSDCGGEDTDDVSSSKLKDVTKTNEDKSSENDALSSFREQWKRELGGSSSPQRVTPDKASVKSSQEQTVPDNDEIKAKQLFRRGVELERNGRLYEAVQHYKRAVQLLPDVERRLYAELENTDSRDGSEPEPAASSEDSDEGDVDELDLDEDFLLKMHRLLHDKNGLCQPEITHKGCHISELPYELVVMLFRWVVSSELDAVALERLSAVCRGFYIVSREKELWMRLCQRTWGLDCGRPESQGFESWRGMYVGRRRVRLDGCYISRTVYARQGEKNSFKDEVNRPCFRIVYYRYLRFFAEGLVLMRTTPEEPPQCVGGLRRRHYKTNSGILSGHYRLIGDKVVIVLKKINNEKSTTTRYRGRRRDSIYEPQEQNFHMELEVRNGKCRNNGVLSWCGYAVSSGEKMTVFDLPQDKFPPFVFSRVTSYTAHVYAPL